MRDFFLVAFGAVLGAIITVVTNIYLEKRKEDARRDQKFKLLLAELEENYILVQHYSLAGGLAKLTLLKSAWDTVKGDIFPLPPDLQESLRSAYAEVAQFNGLVAYDLEKVEMGSGRLSQALEVKSGEVCEKLGHSRTKLKEHLGVQSKLLLS